MKKVYHAANTRGGAHHGWLKSKHTFSFADYYNPKRNGFGVLKVINDDEVEGGKGFSTHSHRNMEIISIPLSGTLVHRDDMGNHGVIKSGDIQVMSAGTGVVHSEMNGDNDEPVKFLQIWIEPNKREVSPRYQQVRFTDFLQHNEFTQVLSPDMNDVGVWIYQNAWFSIGTFDKGVIKTYSLKNANNGVYVFLIFGEAVVGGQHMQARDGVELTQTKFVTVEVISSAQVLLMEVPLFS